VAPPGQPRLRVDAAVARGLKGPVAVEAAAVARDVAAPRRRPPSDTRHSVR
jgi:hypothetical protein